MSGELLPLLAQSPQKQLQLDKHYQLTIVGLTDEGEGYGFIDGHKVLVPYTIVGESVEGQLYFRRGRQPALRIMHLTVSSPNRAQAFCPKFSYCGGCSLQHLKQTSYRSFKQSLLQGALESHNIDYKVSFGFWGQPSQRRRLALSYKKTQKGLLLGFYRHRSHIVEPIESCPLITPALNRLIAPLREFLEQMVTSGQSGFVHLTDLDGKICLSWSPARFKSRDLSANLIEQWSAFAHKYGIARVTRAAKDLICQLETPVLDWSGHKVPFPSASFLQPSISSQDFMIQQMRRYLDLITFKPEAYFDLFCGLGTFSFPLLSLRERSPLTSYDCDGPAIGILESQSRSHHNWTVQRRDLFCDPLIHFKEKSFVILDPPRAGAKEQIRLLGQQKKPIAVVMISCDAQTLARDMASLRRDGFKLKSCLGIDQFPWTNHIESIALLEKN